jgi:alkaline phosphatase
MASGVKTYNSAINHDNLGRPLPYVTQRAKAQGKATGVLTSVPFSHATPATFAAQQASRNDYAAISEQMLRNPALDLIMGAGHPLFDANGRPRSEPDFRWMSAAAWQALQGPQSPRRLIQTTADFEALAAGRLRVQGPCWAWCRCTTRCRPAAWRRGRCRPAGPAARPSTRACPPWR